MPSTAMWACPSRRLSTSNTGGSKKPSCSAAPRRNRWPAKWRWSPAAPAASGGRVAGASRPEEPLSGALATVTAKLAQAHGADHVRGLQCDVTSEASVIAPFRHAALEFGGLDIAVSNAGIAAAAPLEDTSIELWNHSQGVLATGYFLVGREAFRLMKAQGAGGSIVVIASKNGMVASPQASAYC